MQATLVNDWYLTTDSGGSMGTTDTSGITTKQIHNATKVYTYFSNLGWSLSAIAGMLGNMQVESWLSPAYIQQNSNVNTLPNRGANLSDVPNSVMISYYNGEKGLGLVQWNGYTPNNPPGQKLVSFAERYNLVWYDGDTQLFRLKREYEEDLQFQQKTISGYTWNWNNYITTTKTPEEASEAWRQCYEVGGNGSINRRKANARYWYDYFSQGPTPPTPPTPTDEWIAGSTFASYALAYNGQYLPYSQYDCIGFVNLVWRDIAVVAANNYNLPNGTNTLWRRNMSGYPSETYNTTSPDGQNPTPVLWYKDTIANCIATFGEIPTGALLFHKIGEDDNPQIPSQYRGDGIGNFVHVGIYVGNNQVMQSGGRDSSSIPGGGVHLSTYDSSAWNYVAFVVYVDCSGQAPEPPGPTPIPFDYKILYYFGKRCNKNERNRKVVTTSRL